MSVQTSRQEESGLLTGHSFPAGVRSGRSPRSCPSGRAGQAEHFIFLNESENFQICPQSQTSEEVSGWLGIFQGKDPLPVPHDLLIFKGVLADCFLASECHGEG